MKDVTNTRAPVRGWCWLASVNSIHQVFWPMAGGAGSIAKSRATKVPFAEARDIPLVKISPVCEQGDSIGPFASAVARSSRAAEAVQWTHCRSETEMVARPQRRARAVSTVVVGDIVML